MLETSEADMEDSFSKSVPSMFSANYHQPEAKFGAKTELELLVSYIQGWFRLASSPNRASFLV